MADDPNRDILPVREGSCADTCRSTIDLRERHIVYKLDRYELEDKYLRLLEEASSLKKLSNCQEDKIKRLATKLMRATANPRTCSVAFDVYEDKNKLIALELENSKLKDKISVLRNQLLSHTICGRSSSRSRNPQARPSSGRVTCRSESSRTKIPSCHCIIETVNDDYEARRTIEELEVEKKKMFSRIAQLEKELSVYTATNQREKVAENVEYIRCWRQMKQLSDKLIASRNTNDSLNVQINDLKRMLEEATKTNQETMVALLAEKRRSAESDEQVLKAKESQLSLREKQERINDLVNEMKILQQHNNELMALTSEKGNVELENMELKRKVNEQRHDQETLKTVFNVEQNNIVALQSTNEQLLGKLNELQKNMDSLTVQLTSFQAHTEKQEGSKTTLISTKQPDKEASMAPDRQEPREFNANRTITCTKCHEENKNTTQKKEYVTRGLQTYQSVDKSVQTEDVVRASNVDVKDQGTSTMTPVKERSKEESLVRPKLERPSETENPLTPEKMLKLLEQAQINIPPDGARYVPKDVDSNVEYHDILDLKQRHSDAVTQSQAPQESPAYQNGPRQQKRDKHTSPAQPLDCRLPDTTKMLCFLFNVLQEYSITGTMPEAAILYRPTITVEHRISKDINNNLEGTTTRASQESVNVVFKDQQVESHRLDINAVTETSGDLRSTIGPKRTGCGARRFCSNELRQEKLKRKISPQVKWRNKITRLAKTENCNCNETLRCNFDSECERGCCNNVSTFNDKSLQHGSSSTTPRNAPGVARANMFNTVAQSSSQKGLGTMSVTRNLQDETTGLYKSWKSSNGFDETKEIPENDRRFHEYFKQMDKCKELLDSDCSLRNATGYPINETTDHGNAQDPLRRSIDKEPTSETMKVETFCSIDCPNECLDVSSSVSDSFPLVIPDGQGLMELHILSLQLSTSAKQILSREGSLDNVSLFISWDIWDQETAYTSTLKCPKLNFNSSFIYRIPDLSSFFNYILLEFVVFQVYVHHEDNSYVVAAGKICIKDILDYPQNKLHYIVPVNSVIPCSLGMTFGQLSLWIRLSCSMEKMETFKRKSHLLASTVKPKIEPSQKSAPLVENDLFVLKEEEEEVEFNSHSSKEQANSVSSVMFKTEKGE